MKCANHPRVEAVGGVRGVRQAVLRRLHRGAGSPQVVP